MENYKFLLNVGTKMYENTKLSRYCAPVGFLMLTLIGLFSPKYVGAYLLLSGPHGLVNALVIIAYIMMCLGIFSLIFYCVGLILIGLGQIAYNTRRNDATGTQASAPVTNTPKKDTTPILSKYVDPDDFATTTTPPPAPGNSWTCSCGRNHARYETSCICGKRQQDFI